MKNFFFSHAKFFLDSIDGSHDTHFMLMGLGVYRRKRRKLLCCCFNRRILRGYENRKLGHLNEETLTILKEFIAQV